MGINIRKRHMLWLGVIVVSLAMLGVAIGQYAVGGSFPLIVGHPLHVTDIHDDKKLAGISHNIWFGQVASKARQVEDKSDEPYTLYTATVFESLKGTLPASVSVVQYGVDFTDGTQYRVAGDPDLLVPGKSYLFVTRTNAAGDEHTVVPGVGNLVLDVAKGASRDTVLSSDDANELRARFQEAIANQIEYDPNEGEDDGGSDNTSRSDASSTP